MDLARWLQPHRTSKAMPPAADPLQEAVERAGEASTEALAAVNESRRKRGAEPISWEELLERPRQPPGGEAS